jgi:hypothetical protein
MRLPWTRTARSASARASRSAAQRGLQLIEQAACAAITAAGIVVAVEEGALFGEHETRARAVGIDQAALASALAQAAKTLAGGRSGAR